MPQALRHRGESRDGIEKTDQIGTAHNSCVMTSKCIGQLFGLLGADKQFKQVTLIALPISDNHTERPPAPSSGYTVIQHSIRPADHATTVGLRNTVVVG
jgi:hypothetical protein